MNRYAREDEQISNIDHIGRISAHHLARCSWVVRMASTENRGQ
jgi:hypothetical protein